MALPKPNDAIVLLSGGVPVPDHRWNFSQLGSAIAAVRGEYLLGVVAIPLVIVPLKAPVTILWRIEHGPYPS